MPTKTAKRILSIEFKRMDDESPDTSWLGEYSDTRTSEFSIDRRHSLDCQSVQPDNDAIVEKLERSIQYCWNVLDLGEPADILIEAQDRVTECDCSGGDAGRNEYRYFNPSFNYVDKDGHALPGNTPDDVRRYVLQDYQRMESLYRGNWNFIGIRAEARITIGDVIQDITSGGLWGIESDSAASYLKETEQEQLAELRGILHELGFSKRAIASAVKAAKL